MSSPELSPVRTQSSSHASPLSTGKLHRSTSIRELGTGSPQLHPRRDMDSPRVLPSSAPLGGFKELRLQEDMRLNAPFDGKELLDAASSGNLAEFTRLVNLLDLPELMLKPQTDAHEDVLDLATKANHPEIVEAIDRLLFRHIPDGPGEPFSDFHALDYERLLTEPTPLSLDQPHGRHARESPTDDEDIFARDTSHSKRDGKSGKGTSIFSNGGLFGRKRAEKTSSALPVDSTKLGLSTVSTLPISKANQRAKPSGLAVNSTFPTFAPTQLDDESRGVISPPDESTDSMM